MKPVKPEWKDAPEWAQWLAKDKDGDWRWYEQEPTMVVEYHKTHWDTPEDSRYRFAACFDPNAWEETLEKRPIQPKTGEYWPEHGGLYFGRIEEDEKLYALIVARNHEGERTQANWHEAKQFCQCLRIGGFDDWVLPTRLDLLMMFSNNFDNVGVFGGDWYWSSTEFHSTFACVQNFSYGYQDTSYKSITASVRAVRKALI